MPTKLCGKVWEFAGDDYGPCRLPAGHTDGCAYPYIEPTRAEVEAAKLRKALREIADIAARAVA